MNEEEEEMKKEMADLQEINLELDVLTKSTNLIEDMVSSVLAQMLVAFLDMSKIMHPDDEEAQLAYIRKYKSIASKGAAKGTTNALEVISKL
jgi:hypothetical protein